MAKADIGPKIGIEGEAQFRRELQSIQTGLKTLGSEMKVVTSEFAGQEKSTQALTAKNEVLEATVVQLTEKQKLLYEQMQKSAAAYGSADARTQKLTQQYNETTAQINTMNAEIKKNTTQIGANQTALGKLGIDVNALGSKLGLSSTATNKLTSAFSGGAAGAAAFGAAVVKLAADLVKLSDAASQHGDQVSTLATKYNMSAQSIQQFQYMAELTDVSVETITGSLSKLTRNMGSARDGTGSAAQAFAQLGVSVKNSDGSLRSANDVFAESIDALGRVGNETERDALAMHLFGKSAMELNPLIKEGSAGLRELADEAANSGYVMSDKMINVLHQGQDATDRLDKAMDGLKNTIGAGVTPIVAGWKMILAEAADNMAVFIQKMSGMREEADDTTKAINGTTEAVQGLSQSFGDLQSYKDLWTDSQKSYYDYVQRANAYSKETGQTVTVYAPQAMGYDTSNWVATPKVDVTLQIDGQTLARTTYDQFQAEGSRRGSQAYN